MRVRHCSGRVDPKRDAGARDIGGDVTEEHVSSHMRTRTDQVSFGPIAAANRLARARTSLVLDTSERRIVGCDMQPLLTGELALLAYLGSRPYTWHTSHRLSQHVYG